MVTLVEKESEKRFKDRSVQPVAGLPGPRKQPDSRFREPVSRPRPAGFRLGKGD